MQHCDNHPKRQAILISGYHYCSECATEYDQRIIDGWIAALSPNLTLDIIHECCEKLFGEQPYGFKHFHRLYKKYPHEWDDMSQRFVISQKQYIQEVFQKEFRSVLDDLRTT